MTETVTRAPRIETDRLILRAFELDDFDAFCAMLTDPDVTRYLGGVISDRGPAWEKFARVPGFWVLLGYGIWMIEEKETGRIAGNVGFGQFERGMNPPLPDIPEGAWVCARWAQGKGYASEALGAALQWGDENLPNRGYVCIIDPDNAPSLALARKFGFEEVRRSTYRDQDTVVLERPPF